MRCEKLGQATWVALEYTFREPATHRWLVDSWRSPRLGENNVSDRRRDLLDTASRVPCNTIGQNRRVPQ